MPSKINPVVPIELGSKKRHLKFDLNAMVAFEEATGKSLMKGFSQYLTSMKDLRALIWAALLHEDDKLTIKEVGSWIATEQLNDIAKKLIDAFQAAMPEAKKKEKGAKKEKPPLPRQNPQVG